MRLWHVMRINAFLWQGYDDDRYVESMANPDLRWEKSRQLDAGIDLSFFNGRIEFMADYYHKITTDLLYELQLPSNSGYEKTMTNLGKIRNQGLEMSLNTRNIQSRDFLWTTSWNYTMNRSMVLDINDNIIGNGEDVLKRDIL